MDAFTEGYYGHATFPEGADKYTNPFLDSNFDESTRMQIASTARAYANRPTSHWSEVCGCDTKLPAVIEAVVGRAGSMRPTKTDSYTTTLRKIALEGTDAQKAYVQIAYGIDLTDPTATHNRRRAAPQSQWTPPKQTPLFDKIETVEAPKKLTKGELEQAKVFQANLRRLRDTQKAQKAWDASSWQWLFTRRPKL